jgi:transglutaminase/protease-like cytokinesis protein 3
MLPYNEEAIRKVIESFMNCEKSVRVFARQEQDVQLLIAHLRCERTILFHLGEIEYVFYPRIKEAVLNPRYLYSKREYDALVLQLTSTVQKIRDQVGACRTMIERELRIHDILCEKVTYADDGDESHSIVGPLIYQRGVCDGFSKTTKVLLQECGIASHVIFGAANPTGTKSEPHAWNVVCVDNSWYHLDVTFDKTISNIGQRYDYFNLSTKEMSKDHVIDLSRPEVSSLDCVRFNDYYVMSGVYFDTLLSLERYLKQQLAKKAQYLQVRVSDGIEECDVLNTFNSALKALKAGCSYQQSVNSIRHVYEWELKYNKHMCSLMENQH